MRSSAPSPSSGPARTATWAVKWTRKDGHLGEVTTELRVIGTTPDWFSLVPRPLIAGRTLTEQDLFNHAPVVVLSEQAARTLVATAHTVGQKVFLGGDSYEIIGIVKNEINQGGGGVQTPDQGNDAYIPIVTYRERYGDVSIRRTSGSTDRESVELNQVLVEVKDISQVKASGEAIETMLKRFHKKTDYRVSVPLALLEQAEAQKRTSNIVLGSIAGISLLVGGIGIMNIMLASVTERTREIGIRRAIGAKQRQIIGQFLTETVVLSTLGGLVGVAMGVSLPLIISYYSGMPTIVTWYSVVLSLGISMGVGIVFGLYPAVRAARLDPITALRHE